MADVIIQYFRTTQEFPIYAYVQEDNTSVTNLTDVTIDVFEWNSGTNSKGIQVITNQNLAEIDNINFPGWYNFSWLTFDWDKEYVIDYSVPSKGTNAIDVEYLQIFLASAEVVSKLPDILWDYETKQIFKSVQTTGNLGIIKRI